MKTVLLSQRVQSYFKQHDVRFQREAGATPAAFKALEAAQRMTALSARALDKVLRVARTIADLAGSAEVGASHVAEAVQFRALDKLRSYLAQQR